MLTKETLEQFFKDQLSNTSEIFLYKDKQLLKERSFGAFALEQLKKSKKMFWAMVSNIIIAIYHAIYFTIYFEELTVLYTNLFLGIFLIMFASFIIWQAKKYYTIKSSMEFYLMMVNKHDISVEDS